MRMHTRLAGAIVFAVFSIITVILLLPNSGVLHRIPLKSSLDQYAGGLWQWASGKGKDGTDNLRVVALGDSWVNVNDEDTAAGKGDSWPGVFCGEINCTSSMTLAASKSADNPMVMGALTSNEIYLSSFPESERGSISGGLLPDLATQVQAFIASSTAAPGGSAPGSTLFVISYGFWDIYHLASLEYGQAQKLTDDAVDALIAQLDILYALHSRDAIASAAIQNGTSVAPFRAVVPKLLDPSLVPGWLTRAIPPKPSSVAEHQKQAVYLTDRWNSRLQNALGKWEGEGDVHKKVLCYDLPQHVLDLLVEHQLEDAGLSDGAGLGKGESPFESVAEPCVGDDKKVCTEPEQYLFWDDFTLGSVANEGIGKAVAGLVKQKILNA